jgi:hypothetical protein
VLISLLILIFVVLMFVGSWAAWRKSPLYSGKTTLKLLGVTLLILGLFLSVARMNLSANALLTVVLVMVVVVATGGTALLIRITDSHVAQLPSFARLITTHRQKVQRWIWRVSLFLLICGATGLVLPGSWQVLPWCVGALLLLGCGPTLVALYMRARRLDFGMSEVVARPWAHWQYTPAAWAAWAKDQLEWERAKVPPFDWKRDGVAFLKKSLLLGVIFLGCAFIEMDAGFKEKLAFSAALTVGFMALFLWINWFNRRYCERRYRRLLRAPPEAYFGDEGLFCNGEYSQWILSGSYLTEATVINEPPNVLVLLFRKFNGSSETTEAKRIPIPAGCEGDLELLQEKLRGACPKASIHLVARTVR